MSHPRLVHIGDLHLGPNARNADRRAALDQILAEQAGQQVSAWLWPGDLNDARQTIEDKNYLTDRIVRMADVAPVVVVRGNHDRLSFDGGDLDYLAKLGAFYPIYVINTPQVVHLDLTTGGRAAIFCLPYPERGSLLAAGVPPEEINQAARVALEGIFRPAVDELRAAAAAGEVPLMLGHINVGGAILSTGQPSIGREIELDQALLAPFGDIPILLNHVHRHQHIPPNIWYAGSCCRLTFGEVEPKVYQVVEFTQEAA